MATFLQHCLVFLSIAVLGSEISREQALQIAMKAEHGFLGTWVQANHADGVWFIRAFSKSAKPPVAYLIDQKTGAILFSTSNSDNVSLEGLAFDSSDGASILIFEKHRVSVDGVKVWPRRFLGKNVSVKGRLEIGSVNGAIRMRVTRPRFRLSKRRAPSKH